MKQKQRQGFLFRELGGLGEQRRGESFFERSRIG